MRLSHAETATVGTSRVEARPGTGTLTSSEWGVPPLSGDQHSDRHPFGVCDTTGHAQRTSAVSAIGHITQG